MAGLSIVDEVFLPVFLPSGHKALCKPMECARHMTLDEKNALYDVQKQKILNFVELLHDSLICEHGKALLCLYQCE